jgi:hypothetical protein
MSRRRLIHTTFLLVLPLVVAWFGLSLIAALILVLAALLWRWLIVISDLFSSAKRSAIILETTSTSHFAEKARWCLDRLGVEYEERQSAGIVGVLFTGRTVPRLRFRTGIVESSIGHSPEILRFLFGQYGCAKGGKAAFLEPTPERLALEKTIDRYGVDLQVWINYHLLLDKELILHLWGANHPLVPWWQRVIIRPLFPLNSAFVRRSFSITEQHYAKAVEHIDHLLGDIDTRLADGRKSILGGNDINYVDITFAAISGLWLQPDNYGGGMADASRVARNKLPGPMRDDIERWIHDHPRATGFIVRMYEKERLRD